MSSYETSSLNEVEDILEGLEEPTSQQVFDATRPYSARAIAAVAAKTADSGGGGGGGAEFPEPWTVNADGSTTVASSDPEQNVFQVEVADDFSASYGFAVVDDTGNAFLYVSPGEAVELAPDANRDDGTRLTISEDGTFNFRDSNGSQQLTFTEGGGWDLDPQNGGVSIRDGVLRIARGSAPDDAIMFNGSFALWLDAGASELKIKANVGGVIKTASIPLT